MDAQNQNQPHQQAASPPPATVSDISSYQAPQQQQPPQQYQQQYQQPQYQQQQPTYIQPAMHPMPTMRSPRLGLYSKSQFTTKIVLRSFDLVFGIILIALAVSLLFVSTYSAIYYFFFFCIPIGGLVFIWETAEFITICARGGKLGIHPGAHVGMHLVIWLLTAIGIGFGATILAYDYDYDYDSYYRGSTWRRNRDPTVAYTTLAFMCLVLLINFTLFVMACIETQRANAQASAVYFVQADGQMYPMNMAPMPMVQQPMPAYVYSGQQQPMQQTRQSTYSMAPAVAPTGAEAKGRPVDGYNGSVAAPSQQGEGLASPDGTYYGQGNGYSQQR